MLKLLALLKDRYNLDVVSRNDFFVADKFWTTISETMKKLATFSTVDLADEFQKNQVLAAYLLE